jgi:cyclase
VPKGVKAHAALGLALIGCLAASEGYGQRAWEQDGMGLLHVQGNVFMLVGPGGNTTVQAGPDGVLLVDTQTEEASEALSARIAALSEKPIQYIVNTNADSDHVGGNAAFAALGRAVFGGNVAGVVDREVLGAKAQIMAHENVLTAMSRAEPAIPFEAWPTDVYYTDKKELFFNGEGVQIFHQPAAHTDGDSIVFFRRSDVVSTGDIFSSHRYPVIDLELDLALPALMQEGGTMIIPGHGRLCDEADVVEYRDMVVIVRDRILDMIDRGMTLRQVQAARPTLGYDGQYGLDDENWTAEDFVTAVYRDLRTAGD